MDKKIVSKSEFDKKVKEFWDYLPDEDKEVLRHLIEINVFTEDEIIRLNSNLFDIYEIKKRDVS